MNLQKGKDPALKLDLSFLLYASRGIILPSVSERKTAHPAALASTTMQRSHRAGKFTGSLPQHQCGRSVSVSLYPTCGPAVYPDYARPESAPCAKGRSLPFALLHLQGPRLCLYISPLFHSSTRSKCIFDVSQDSLSLTMSNSTAPHMATRFRTSSSVSTSMPERRTRSWGNRARPPSLSGGTMLSLVTDRRSNPPPFWRTYLYLLPLIASFPLNKGVDCRAAPGVSVSGQRVTPNI